MRRPFYGDESKRQFYMDRMAAHIAADELIQGFGWLGGWNRGCFIGCTLDDYNHDTFCKAINVPMQVAYICDTLHESLPRERTAEFAMRFFREVNLEGNTEHWWPKFAIALLTDPHFKLVPSSNESIIVQKIADLYQREIDGNPAGDDEWKAVRDITGGALFSIASGYATVAMGDTAIVVSRRIREEEAVWTARQDFVLYTEHFIWQAETFLDIISRPAN